MWLENPIWKEFLFGGMLRQKAIIFYSLLSKFGDYFYVQQM